MAAAWDDVGRAGNVLQLLGVDAFGLAGMIAQAALTARRNRDACMQLAGHAHVVAGLLKKLQALPRLRQHPETRRPLEQLDDALRRAYLLVRSCGQDRAARSYLYQLFTGARTAAKLRAAEEEIDRYIRLVPMISLVATVRVKLAILWNWQTFSPPLPIEDVPGSTAVPGHKPAGDDLLLPSLAEFKIVGEPRSGFPLRACGYPINGPTAYDYVVTADDFDTVLAVECVPMDDNGLQGELMTSFANGKNKIACDSDLQSEIDVHMSNEAAHFSIFLKREVSGDEWEPATVAIRRTGYLIILKCTNEVAFEEEYSRALQIKISYGRTTQFVLVSSGSVSLTCNTSGRGDVKDYDLRLRDLIVLIMREFQKKALTLNDGEKGES